MIKICKYFLSPFEKSPVLRDTRAALSLPAEHALNTSWHNGSSLGPHVLNGYGSMTLATTNTIYGKRDPALVDMWGTSYQNMKYQSSLRRRVITGGSEKAARVSQRMDCRIGVIKFYVSVNNQKVTINIDHVPCMWVHMLFVCLIEIDD